MADEDHGDVALASERGQCGEERLDVGVAVFVRVAEKRAYRVDDEEAAIGDGFEEVFESGQVAAQGEGAGDACGRVSPRLVFGCFGETAPRGDGEDFVEIGAERFEAWSDGVGEVVFGSEKEDGRRESRVKSRGTRARGGIQALDSCLSALDLLVRPWTAPGDAGGDIEG
jgi:hypothetical protein